LCGKVWNRKHA